MSVNIFVCMLSVSYCKQIETIFTWQDINTKIDVLHLIFHYSEYILNILWWVSCLFWNVIWNLKKTCFLKGILPNFIQHQKSYLLPWQLSRNLNLPQTSQNFVLFINFLSFDVTYSLTFCFILNPKYLYCKYWNDYNLWPKNIMEQHMTQFI